MTQIAAVWWPLHPGLTSVAVRPFVTYHLPPAISCWRDGFFVEIYETKRPLVRDQSKQMCSEATREAPRSPAGSRKSLRLSYLSSLKKDPYKAHYVVLCHTSQEPFLAVDPGITTRRPQPSCRPPCIIAVPVVTALPTWDLQCRLKGSARYHYPNPCLSFIQG